MTRDTDQTQPPTAKPSDQPAVGTSPAAPGDAAPQDGERLATPFERDESTGDAGTEPHDSMKQAKRDLDAGQVDTDLRNSGGVDDAQRQELLRRER